MVTSGVALFHGIYLVRFAPSRKFSLFGWFYPEIHSYKSTRSQCRVTLLQGSLQMKFHKSVKSFTKKKYSFFLHIFAVWCSFWTKETLWSSLEWKQSMWRINVTWTIKLTTFESAAECDRSCYLFHRAYWIMCYNYYSFLSDITFNETYNLWRSKPTVRRKHFW